MSEQYIKGANHALFNFSYSQAEDLIHLARWSAEILFIPIYSEDQKEFTRGHADMTLAVFGLD